MSLFMGRDDVYAKRWENRKKGSSGYSPVCGNEWIPGICQKPKIKCSACKNKKYLKLDRQAIESHLRGKIVIGIYPLLSDEKCWFLAMDFDGEGWRQDITAIMQSIIRKGEVKEFVKDYGMVIVDECHHVPAVSFEMILKNINAKYVYGLTATPTRKDGHHPIIFMQCGLKIQKSRMT